MSDRSVIGFLHAVFLRSSRAVWNRLGAIGLLVAFLYALPTFGYPFGRDQSIFFYVGREWASGRLPYRDAFDIKPPGIYALYGLSATLLGHRTWSIRVFELLAAFGLAWCASRAVHRDKPASNTEFPAVALLTVGWYYTCFDYWDTAQVEFWEGLFALAGFTVARTQSNWRWAAVNSGILAGIALLFKPPIAVLLPIAGLTVGWRAYQAPSARALVRVQRAAVSMALHGAAAAATIGLVALYFAAEGGWSSLVELVGYTAHYVKNKPTASALGRTWFWMFWKTHVKVWLWMLLALWASGLGASLWTRSWKSARSAVLALALGLLALYSGISQNKYWTYHWVVVTPFLVLAAAHGIAALGARFPKAPVLVALCCLGLGFSYSPAWSSNPTVNYKSYTKLFWKYVRGQEGRYKFLTVFGGPYGYSYVNQEIVGDLIGDHARPGDQLHVRGFEPAIYAVSRLASPSRFASEAPLIDPTLQYKRAQWKAEHDAALWRARPRFIVTFTSLVDDQVNITAHGYHLLGEFANFVWFERN